MVSATAVFAISYHGCCAKITGLRGVNYVSGKSRYSISFGCITFLQKPVIVTLFCLFFPVCYNGITLFFRQLKLTGRNSR
jgi:hypothetical protein